MIRGRLEAPPELTKDNDMRLLIGAGIAASLLVGASLDARAQVEASPSPRVFYPSAPIPGVTPPGAYAFKDEPVMSINNSYLGYSNFVDPNYPAPRYINPHAPVRSNRQATAATTRRVGRWFGWRRRYAQ